MAPQSDLIACENFHGGTSLIERSRLFFRPGVYALIPDEQDRLLLVGTRFTGKYFLPGGAIELGERMEQALIREVHEETGITVAVEGLFHFQELFFHHDIEDYAFHGLIFVHRCRPLTFDLVADDQVDDGIAEKPRWVPCAQLRPEDFQSFARQVFERFQQTRRG